MRGVLFFSLFRKFYKLTHLSVIPYLSPRPFVRLASVQPLSVSSKTSTKKINIYKYEKYIFFKGGERVNIFKNYLEFYYQNKLIPRDLHSTF